VQETPFWCEALKLAAQLNDRLYYLLLLATINRFLPMMATAWCSYKCCVFLFFQTYDHFSKVDTIFACTKHGQSLLENFGETNFVWYARCCAYHTNIILFAFLWRHQDLFVKLAKSAENYGNDIFWVLWPKCPLGYAHGVMAAA